MRLGIGITVVDMCKGGLHRSDCILDVVNTERDRERPLNLANEKLEHPLVHLNQALRVAETHL